MGLIANNQSFYTGASGLINLTSMANSFEKLNDAVLVAGRDITIHLEPYKGECTSSDCRYDTFYKRYISNDNKVCDDCKGQGFIIEPRYTIYRANIRWTNKAFDEGGGRLEEPDSQGFGKVGVDFVRTKTDLSSYDHIVNSVGATIDGLQTELIQEPRKTGFSGRLMNIVAWWRKIDR